MSHSTDPVLDTLFLPFQEAQLQWPADQVLFLRARMGAVTQPYCERLLCEQSFKPDADALTAAGFKLRTSSYDSVRPGPVEGLPSTGLRAHHERNDLHPLTLVLPPRQRDEARALLARAITLTQPGGRVVASLSNNEGARSGEADLEKLAGPVTSLSKHKCRVFWVTVDAAQINASLLAEWLQLDAPRTISDARFVSRPGVFAWDRIDPASALLAKHLPKELKGRAADLGSGFGYLSVELLNRCAGITALDLYEAEARALELAKQNLASYKTPVQYHWHDVTRGLLGAYDVIISNPPFHTQSRADRPDIGKRFISAAAEALNPGGCLWLVANRHLPYEEVLTSSFGHTRIVAQQDGFKIVLATKAAASNERAPRKPRK